MTLALTLSLRLAERAQLEGQLLRLLGHLAAEQRDGPLRLGTDRATPILCAPAPNTTRNETVNATETHNRNQDETGKTETSLFKRHKARTRHA